MRPAFPVRALLNVLTSGPPAQESNEALLSPPALDKTPVMLGEVQLVADPEAD